MNKSKSQGTITIILPENSGNRILLLQALGVTGVDIETVEEVNIDPRCPELHQGNHCMTSFMDLNPLLRALEVEKPHHRFNNGGRITSARGAGHHPAKFKMTR